MRTASYSTFVERKRIVAKVVNTPITLCIFKMKLQDCHQKKRGFATRTESIQTSAIKQMSIKSIIQQLNQKYTEEALRRGLRVCPQAEQIMSLDDSYAPIAKSIWQNIDDKNEYVACLSASDYKDDSNVRKPDAWAYKVPGIIALHLRMAETPECENLVFDPI